MNTTNAWTVMGVLSFCLPWFAMSAAIQLILGDKIPEPMTGDRALVGIGTLVVSILPAVAVATWLKGLF